MRPEWTSYLTLTATLILATLRVGGVFLVAPVFASSALPWRIRAFASIVIGLAVAGSLGRTVSPDAGWSQLAIAAVCELAVGATLGYAARLVLAGVELGALHVGHQVGFSLAETFDPITPGAPGAIRRFLQLLAVVIFLCIGGHRMVIRALLSTFEYIPIAGFSAEAKLLDMIVALLGASFLLALKIAAPVLIAVLLAVATLGLVQKTVPQCNTLSVALPGRVIVGLLAIAVSLAAVAGAIEGAFALTFRRIALWLSMLG